MVELLDVVNRVAPHALVGVTGQPGLFTEAVVRSMAAQVERPIVLPLSNPTPRAEAIPDDIVEWAGTGALIGTGSPFDPVPRGDTIVPVAQVNNVYVFPGIGLGVIAVRASAVSDEMLTAAATAIGEAAARDGGGALLPPITQTRAVAREVAVAVARTAIAQGLAEPLTDDQIDARIDASTWHPEYRPLV